MLIRVRLAGKTGLISLLLPCLLMCRSSMAGTSSIADTTGTSGTITSTSDGTAPATATTDTVHFIVYDYNTASFINNQFLPIDRAFNIKIINIPPDSSVKSMQIWEFEGRYRRSKYKFKNGELVRPEEVDSLIIYRRILCIRSGITAKKGEQIFLVPKHLIPNREYVVAMGNNTTRELSKGEQTSFTDKITPMLKHDVYFRTIFNRTLTHYYNNPNATYAPLRLSQDSLSAHLQRMVRDSFPNYMLRPVNDTLVDQQLAHSVDAVTNLKRRLTDLKDNCIKDSTSKKSADLLDKQAAKDDMDWFGLADSSRKDRIRTDLEILHVDSGTTCGFHRKSALEKIDSIAKYVTSEVAEAAAQALAGETFFLGTIESTYFVDIAKNAQRNVTIDLGAGYSWSMDRPFLYTAINVYFRPIDKNLPLRNTYYSFWDYIGSHASLLVGMTLTPVNKDKIREGILGNKGLILGSGFRFLPWFKVSGGTLMYYGLNENPLNSSRRTRFTPFVSMSIDVDVKTIFKSFPIIDETLFK